VSDTFCYFCTGPAGPKYWGRVPGDPGQCWLGGKQLAEYQQKLAAVERRCRNTAYQQGYAQSQVTVDSTSATNALFFAVGRTFYTCQAQGSRYFVDALNGARIVGR
jgi:hypothetical protein